jgi:thioredoxin-related protein
MPEMMIRPSRCGPAFFVALTLCAPAAFAQEAAPKASGAVRPARRSTIYDKKSDALAQVKQAAALAKHENTRILLMFGGDWCSWCHKLHELFATDPEIRKILRDEYALVLVDTEAPNAADLERTCKQALTKEELLKGVGYPFLAVMDASAKVITAQPTGVLEEGDHHNPKKVKDFLSRFTTPRKNATALLEEALSRAAADDKRIFLRFGAPSCGWCHRLDDWVARPEVSAILERDFLVLKVDIDRMTAGKDVMKRFRGQAPGGIPWYVILDSNGKSLGTADAPGQNIGYPLEPKEIDAFLGLLKGQCRHIEAGQLERLRHSLEEAAAQIQRGRRS